MAVATVRLSAIGSIRHLHKGQRAPWLLRWGGAVAAAAGVLALVAVPLVPSPILALPFVTLLLLWLYASQQLLFRQDAALEVRSYAPHARWHRLAPAIAVGALISPLTPIALATGAAWGILAKDGVLAVQAAIVLTLLGTLLRLVVGSERLRERMPWLGVVASAVLFGVTLAAGALWTSDHIAALGWALITVALLAIIWVSQVAMRLVSPVPYHDRETVGVFAIVPPTPWGAVAARTFVSWGRDPRYTVAWATLLVLPFLMVTPLIIAGASPRLTALIPIALLALFAGWLPHNDVAYDGYAYWQSVGGRVRGWQDRLGRIIPSLIAGLALAVAAAWVATLLLDRAEMLPTYLGALCAILGISLGVSSVMSLAWPYPATPLGESPYRAPSHAGWASGIAPGLAFLVSGLLALPIALPAALATPAEPASWVLPVGATTGVVACAIGVIVGGVIMDRRSPEVLARLVRN